MTNNNRQLTGQEQADYIKSHFTSEAPIAEPIETDETDKPQTLAEQFANENSLSVEINQAYIDNIGEQYATAEDVQEAYCGQFDSNEDFAQDLAEQIGSIKSEVSWPYTCIDWEYAAREIMYDYFEVNGYYFRNL
jgi:antirestriction protein